MNVNISFKSKMLFILFFIFIEICYDYLSVVSNNLLKDYLILF